MSALLDGKSETDGSYPPPLSQYLSVGIHRQGGVIHRLPLFHVKHSMRLAR